MFDWLQHLVDVWVYSILGLSPQSHLGQALQFFFFDTIKILILLFAITIAMGIVNSYFPVDRIRHFLSQHKLYGFEYFVASVFGAVTPFCSCSSVPLFIGFVKGGIPLGVTFAFLVTSPLVNEVAVAIFLGMFGLKATLTYVASGIVLGVVSGAILSRMNLEPLLTDWVRNMWKQSKVAQGTFNSEETTFAKRLPFIGREAFGIIQGVLPYIVIGVAIGAAMHGYIPEGFFEAYIGKDTWYAVPLAVVLGIPLYANAAGILPVIQVFVAKGIPIGTSLAFMMAVVGLSIPEAMLLKKVMTTQLVLLFFGVVAACIILSGYVFNIIL